MTTPTSAKTITAQGNFLVGKVPGERQGVVIAVAGTFNGATVTAGYRNPGTDTVTAYSGADASITADGEIAIVAGNGVEIFLLVTVADPTSIDPLTSFF